MSTLTDAVTGHRVVIAQASAGSGCGGFGAELWAAFRPASDGSLGNPVSTLRGIGPSSVVDVDDDGFLDLVGPESLWVGGQDGYRRIELPELVFGCRC